MFMEWKQEQDKIDFYEKRIRTRQSCEWKKQSKKITAWMCSSRGKYFSGQRNIDLSLWV